MQVRQAFAVMHGVGGGQRLRGTHLGVFNRLVAHLEELKRRDPDLALMMQDYISRASMAVERRPDGPPAVMVRPARDDGMDYMPTPKSPWDETPRVEYTDPVALSGPEPRLPLGSATEGGSADFAPAPVAYP